MKVQLDKTNRWFYRIVSTANGQTMLTSQVYATKWTARRAARRFAAINNLEYEEVAK
jgi:uncharacterized protein YegP (UPF0339 family)